MPRVTRTTKIEMSGLSVEVSEGAVTVRLVGDGGQLDEVVATRTVDGSDLRSFCDDVMYEIDKAQKNDT